MFIRHILNYTGYNQKCNVTIRSEMNSSSAGSVWVLLYTCIRGLVQRVIETGMTKVMAVRVEEITPLREELDSSEDSEEESCAV